MSFRLTWAGARLLNRKLSLDERCINSNLHNSQAFDRVHRLGQLRPVFVQRLVIANTVEDRVLAMQDRKVYYLYAGILPHLLKLHTETNCRWFAR